MTGRPPSREESALWRKATRDVAPREDAGTAAPQPPVVEAGPSTRTARAPRSSPKPAVAALPDLAPNAAPGLDRRSADRLRRGERPIDGRLDLHGMTQEEAHRAVDHFLARAQDAGWRCVLVITGKGGRGGVSSAGGVLRAAVPRWLNEAPNRARLLAFTPAQPKDGGAGALYVLLRRRR
jgi:DNA-nicking Smr family endonuclease